MRRRNQKEYPHTGSVLTKNFTTEEYATVPITFKYRPFEGKKSKFVSEQLIEGYISTDEGRIIETLSSIDFRRGYKIKLASRLFDYKIIEVGIAEDDKLKYGIYRNRINRDIKVLVLS
jgi:hypothetical protein